MKHGTGQVSYVVLAVLLILGLFYWFQYRPSEIRKACYREVYSNNTNLEWAEGKEWAYYKDGKWGWLFPYWQARSSEEDIYRGCLLFNGIK